QTVNPDTIAGNISASVPDMPPQVQITNVYPQKASFEFPVNIAVDVMAQNITGVNFTVDTLLSGGQRLRWESVPVLREVTTNGVLDYVDEWSPGVDKTNFSWDMTLPMISDGTKSDYVSAQESNGIT